MRGKIDFRVRYQETDQMGVVYNANYLVWFEMGRTELCRSLGISYREMEELGICLPVVEALCRYKKPARYDDLVTVLTNISKLTPVRIEFIYQVLHGEELLVEGKTVHGFTTKDGKLLRLNRTHPQVWEIISRGDN